MRFNRPFKETIGMASLRAITVVAATVLAFSSIAAPAHVKIIASTPAANALVAKPGKISMTFSEKLVGPTVRVELFMTGMPAGMAHHGGMDHAKMDHSKMDHGKMADHAPVKIPAGAQFSGDGKSLTLVPKRALGPGKYKVSWSAVGADMHKMGGSYSFTVK
jgi:copper resistance protein C